jgi:transposase
LDVQRDFCEVAIWADGGARSAGQVRTTPQELELFAPSLGKDDEVALEASGPALAVARILRPHVARVVVCSANQLRSINRAKARTDCRDARELARLLASGTLSAIWIPDERTQALRRQTARRMPLVRQRTRAKNEIHAVLHRNLKGRPPVSDLFGSKGRLARGA